jgi:virulence-associated protein VapD
MFAIAFDLSVRETEQNHPKGVAQAYSEIGAVFHDFGFARIQGSVYVTDNDSLANLFSAIMSLKRLPWLPRSVRDIRAFKIEHWSDFTPVIKAS